MASSIVAGGATANISTSATGLNPAWRKAAVHAVTGAGWPEGATSAEIDVIRTSLKNTTAQLRALAPDSGAYFNEVCIC